jgi:hypothetical protein
VLDSAIDAGRPLTAAYVDKMAEGKAIERYITGRGYVRQGDEYVKGGQSADNVDISRTFEPPALTSAESEETGEVLHDPTRPTYTTPRLNEADYARNNPTPDDLARQNEAAIASAKVAGYAGGTTPDHDDRLVVTVLIDGKPIMLYRSAKGTSGKIKGKFYPFLGEGDAGWFIKGTVQDMDHGYHVRAVQNAMDAMNNRFGRDATNAEVIAALQADGAPQALGIRKLSEQHIGGQRFTDWKHSTTTPDTAIERARSLYGSSEAAAAQPAPPAEPVAPSVARDTRATLTPEPDFPARPAMTGEAFDGRASELVTADGGRRGVRYSVVEADDIIPTHNPREGYQRNPAGDLNERPYEDVEAGQPSRVTGDRADGVEWQVIQTVVPIASRAATTNEVG